MERLRINLDNEIKPIPQATWVPYRGAKTLLVWECSRCRYGVTLQKNTPYCPNCGAQMINGKE